MARASNTRERRQQIVRGLFEVMASHGYEGASVARVARAARLTPGLVHYHFGDKREILLALLDFLSAAAMARVTRRLEQAGDSPASRVNAWIDAFLATGPDEDPRAVACWVGIAAEAVRELKIRNEYRRVIREHQDLIETLLSEAMDEPRRSKAVRAAGAAVLAAVEGYFLLAAVAPDAVPRHSAAAAMEAMVDGLVRAARR